MTSAAQINDCRTAYAAAQGAALRGGAVVTRPASAEVEAKLSKLLLVTTGMFAAAVTSVVAVGIWLF